MKKYLAAATLVLGLLLSAPTANAALVEEWSYSVSGVFGTDYLNDYGTRAGIEYLDNGTTLRWGSRGAHSLISLFARSGIAETNGAQASGMDLYHQNQSINNFDRNLASGTAHLSLELTPMRPGAEALTFAATLSFAFFETLNTGDYQDDIFVVRDITAATQRFTYDGQEYEFSFAASFMNLRTDVDAWYYNYVIDQLDLPAGSDVYGWVTPENQNTTIPTWLEIKKIPPVPTPEPGALALMGLGLLVAGFAAWRRRAGK